MNRPGEAVTALAPQETLAREVFAALEARDLATLHVLLSPSVVLHVPGQNPYAGDYHGHQGFLEFWGKLSRRAGGRMEVRVQEVLAARGHAAVLGVSVLEREGERLEHRAVYVLRLEEGRVAECWVHNYDQRRVDAFWG